MYVISDNRSLQHFISCHYNSIPKNNLLTSLRLDKKHCFNSSNLESSKGCNFKTSLSLFYKITLLFLSSERSSITKWEKIIHDGYTFMSFIEVQNKGNYCWDTIIIFHSYRWDRPFRTKPFVNILLQATIASLMLYEE